MDKGYACVKCPDHPRANSVGYVRRAILIAEAYAGRPIDTTEHVHHINRITDDDRPENLQILTAADHMRLHGDLLRTERLGRLNPAAKLSEDAVRAIYEARSESTGSLAARYGVSVRAIRNIKNGSNWNHLTGAASC